MFLARVTLILAVVILGVNLLLARPVVDSVLFSLALAVGLTPQMLPAIVSFSLATGARRMAARRVIVRRLDAIEDFGSMDLLCTDKTGTLTDGRVSLDGALGPDGRPDPQVAALAAVNATLQTGFANPIDTAIRAATTIPGDAQLVGEVPFDFTRKRLGVLVDHDDNTRELIVKGALTSVLDTCTTLRQHTVDVPLDDVQRQMILRRYEQLSADGYRVLGVAARPAPDIDAVHADDERDLTFRGLLTFQDPPKPGVRDAVGRLEATGVTLRMLTGDNPHVATHTAAAVGLAPGRVVTGADLVGLDDDDLARAVRDATVFAEVDPLTKERILDALRATGLTVGYLGDGINDAGALQRADVGISVDSAVDVAKQTAAIVLLDKDLDVLADGVQLGRQTFANTLKYVFTTVSANFGNMASMAAASAFLPFLPLLPRQILLLNFLSDIPSATLAADAVDPEQHDRPQHWDIRFVRDFMVTFGLISSGFDLLTFAVLLHIFDAGPGLFHTGWFVGSTLTELAVLFVLRTRRPIHRSRPGTALVISSAIVAAVTLALPYLPPAARALGLQPLRASVLAALLAIVAAYVTVTGLIKPRFYRAITRNAHGHDQPPSTPTGVVAPSRQR